MEAVLGWRLKATVGRLGGCTDGKVEGFELEGVKGTRLGIKLDVLLGVELGLSGGASEVLLVGDLEGVKVGLSEGPSVGPSVGIEVGILLGLKLGWLVVCAEESSVGKLEGCKVGGVEGIWLRIKLGRLLGLEVGWIDATGREIVRFGVGKGSMLSCFASLDLSPAMVVLWSMISEACSIFAMDQMSPR